MLLFVLHEGISHGVEVPEELCHTADDLYRVVACCTADVFGVLPWEHMLLLTEDGVYGATRVELTDLTLRGLSEHDIVYLTKIPEERLTVARGEFDEHFAREVREPLATALVSEDASIVHKLISSYQNLNLYHDYDGTLHFERIVSCQTPLYLALEVRSLDICEALLRNKADPNLGYEEVDFPFFHDKVKSRLIEMMNIALAVEGDGGRVGRFPDALREEFSLAQWNALSADVAQPITEFVGDMEDIANNTMSYDYWTLQRNYPDVFQTTSITPLWEAAGGSNSAALCSLLLRFGADPNLASSEGPPLASLFTRDPSTPTEKQELLATAKVLLEAGAKVGPELWELEVVKGKGEEELYSGLVALLRDQK